jgi:D-beta-D-heptose 7-phosphate kinase/D-beta-D-heptose 1-phosphate adenosyltransferase
MSDKLIRILPKIKDVKVLVVGDALLDEYIWTEVNRISPEAPVPIAEALSTTYSPGGAANVASNIQALGGKAYLIGILGRDINAKKLRMILKERDIDTRWLVTDWKRPTTLKSRILARGQQVVRIDHEQKKFIDGAITRKIMEIVTNIIEEVDAVIISDYNKGVITPTIAEGVISIAKKYNKIVSVDPKGRDYSKYRGATIVTPNQHEVEVVVGEPIVDEESVRKAGQKLLSELNLEYVLITRGEKGLSLVGEKDMVIHIPAVTSEVYDVTGAGDTVISTLTLSLAAGANVEAAARLANYAAGVVVTKTGTYAPSIDEMEKTIRNDAKEGSGGKIISSRDLVEIVEELKEKDKRIVFTNGCFDILHIGHVRYLEEAKKLGDILIIGVNSDESVRILKGKGHPIIPAEERAEIIAALRCVDYVITFHETNPENLISQIKPDIHVKGGNYTIDKIPESKLVESLGGKTVILKEIQGKSTSNIIQKIALTNKHRRY